MTVWSSRGLGSRSDTEPLSPAQVDAMRVRAHRLHTAVVLSALVGSIVLVILIAVLFGANSSVHQPGIVAFCAVGVAVLLVSLGFAIAGYETPAVIVMLVVSWLTIMVVVSRVSAGLSIESHLFGIAALSVVLVRQEMPVLRAGLASGALVTYIVCELRWPEGSGGAELTGDLAHNVAVANKVFAGLLIGIALVLSEYRHRSMMHMLRGAARYGELRATTDELTGVFNRRPVIAQLSEWAERGRGNYAIALIDLDHFKNINDEFGHDCGDATIQSVAETLRKHFRDSDMVSRWGGDEFLVLMPGVRHADLEPILERLRQAVTLAHTRCHGSAHTVTVSIGAAMGALGQTPDECIAAADHALYRAKEEGRNRVVTVGTARPTSALGRPAPEEVVEEPWETRESFSDRF